MKIFIKCVAAILALLALTAAVFGIVTAVSNRNRGPVLLKPSQIAIDTADAMLTAISDGDYEKASGLILGKPDLGVDRKAKEEVGVLMWDAYQESLEYTPLGDSFATDTGIARNYTVRYLDVNSVMVTLRERSQALLEKRVAEAENVSEVYDENNEYREDFVMDVLYDAAEQALKEDVSYVEETFTVNLVHREGKWWVVYDESLKRAISGSLAG